MESEKYPITECSDCGLIFDANGQTRCAACNRRAHKNKPPVIHVVTPESSSGTLWAEVQRLQAVEAESARTVAHLNQTHREVSEMQTARIEELESVLAQIGDCREHPQCANARLARRAIEQTEPKPSTERIAELEEALATIADHRTQLPWSECRRIARAALGPANLQETAEPVKHDG